MAADWEGVECPECKQKFQMEKGSDSCTCPACHTRIRWLRAENTRMIARDNHSGADSGLGCIAVAALVIAVLYALSEASL